MFGGGGFYRDLLGFAADALRHGFLHRGDVRVDFGSLGDDGDVAVAECVAFLFDEFHDSSEQFLAIDAFVLWVAVGEMVAYVAESRSAEYGVA